VVLDDTHSIAATLPCPSHLIPALSLHGCTV
jgi:hypothetical protein